MSHPDLRSATSMMLSRGGTRRRIGPHHVGHLGLRVVVLGLVLSSLGACTSQASGHIRVVRSFFLERGHLIQPRALVGTEDGGYVIAGQFFGPWATRVNNQGQVVWRYVAPRVRLTAGEIQGDSLFTGAVTLPDDSTLLCGYSEPTETPNSPLTGLLTHLSPHGRVLNTETLYPDNDPHYVLNYLDHCIRWGKGVAVVGHTTRYPKHGAGTNYLWLLKLDAHGNIQWQKLISNVGDSQILALPDRQLLLAWTPYDKTDLVRLDAQGDVTARGSLPGEGVLVHPLTTGPTLSVVSVLSKPHLRQWTINAALRDVAYRRGDSVGAWIEMATRRAYALPNGALALFGGAAPYWPKFANKIGKYLEPVSMLLGGIPFVFLPAPRPNGIQWISPHMHRQQLFTFKRWGWPWIADAIPAGQPGEFATIRVVGMSHNPHNERSRMGIILAIVRIQ